MKCLSKVPFTSSGLLPELVKDYLQGDEATKSLYAYPPSTSSFKQTIENRKNRPVDRKALTEVLLKQYSFLPENSLVSANVQLLLNENTFTVCAAHQPNFLLGPLYTVYKILSAIKLSQQLKQSYPAFNFVPVYWMGSEDHDFAELNHAYFNGEKVAWESSEGGAIGRMSTASLSEAINRASAVLPSSDLLPVWQDWTKQHQSFAQFTQHVLHVLFSKYGLVVLDQDDAALKSILAPAIVKEVAEQVAERELQSVINYLSEKYNVQAKPRPINFFYLGDGFRERIVWEQQEQCYKVLNTSLTFTKEAILEEIKHHPERFSPNVIYRPLYQEMVLPNLAFVGGTGELSYWLELKPLFDFYSVPFPLLIHRDMAVLLPENRWRKLEKLGLKAEAFLEKEELVIKKYLAQTTDVSLREHRKNLEDFYDKLAEQVASVDVTLRGTVASEKQKSLNALDALESKMVKAVRKKEETAIQQIKSIHQCFYPEGTLQERRENFLPFYTNTFFDELLEHFDPLSQQLKVVVTNT